MGDTLVKDSSFINNSADGSGGAIFNDAYSRLYIIAENRNVEFTGNKADGSSNALFNSGETFLNAASGKSIIFNDAIDGGYKNRYEVLPEESSIVIVINSSEVSPNTSGTVEINNSVSSNDVVLDNGVLKFGTYNGAMGSFKDDVNFLYNDGIVTLQNGSINNTNLGNLILNSDMDLRLDADFANMKIDTINASDFEKDSHNINISNISVLTPTYEKSFSLSPLGNEMSVETMAALSGAIQYTGGDVYTPIYRYATSYDPASGMLNFGVVGGEGSYKNFNPSVLAAPVAAQLGGYLNQLNSYDEAFRNMDMYMLMTKEQRQAMKYKNKYASAANENIVFDPSLNQYEQNSGWFRPYATFENVALKNGPKVSNVAYGTYFGLDSELYELSHGWDGMFSVYAGYNGSHQAYDGVSIYQNGGTLGLTGIAYKGDFFTGLTANVGASAASANSFMGQEDFAMLMTGIASKTGYNFEFADGKFILQPSMLMSYSLVNTFDYTNALGVRIDSDPLHAIQLEPGLKLIGNLNNGWQPYAGVSVVWNIMDRTQFKANDVSLPNLSVDPFVKYGVGVRKSWGERFTGFLQTYITNGGRNGVGLQAGFRWTLGKS